MLFYDYISGFLSRFERYLEYRRWSLQPFLRAPFALAKLVALSATLLPKRVKELLAQPMSQNKRGDLYLGIDLI